MDIYNCELIVNEKMCQFNVYELCLNNNELTFIMLFISVSVVQI